MEQGTACQGEVQWDLIKADLHSTTLFLTGLRHELFRVNQTYNSLTRTVVYVKKIVF